MNVDFESLKIEGVHCSRWCRRRHTASTQSFEAGLIFTNTTLVGKHR